MPATPGALEEAQRRRDAAEKAERERTAREVEAASLLSKTVLTIYQRAGEDGKLFGSVGAEGDRRRDPRRPRPAHRPAQGPPRAADPRDRHPHGRDRARRRHRRLGEDDHHRGEVAPPFRLGCARDRPPSPAHPRDRRRARARTRFGWARSERATVGLAAVALGGAGAVLAGQFGRMLRRRSHEAPRRREPGRSGAGGGARHRRRRGQSATRRRRAAKPSSSTCSPASSAPSPW